MDSGFFMRGRQVTPHVIGNQRLHAVHGDSRKIPASGKSICVWIARTQIARQKLAVSKIPSDLVPALVGTVCSGHLVPLLPSPLSTHLRRVPRAA